MVMLGITIRSIIETPLSLDLRDVSKRLYNRVDLGVRYQKSKAYKENMVSE